MPEIKETKKPLEEGLFALSDESDI